jgi:hypothetical protein
LLKPPRPAMAGSTELVRRALFWNTVAGRGGFFSFWNST